MKILHEANSLYHLFQEQIRKKQSEGFISVYSKPNLPTGTNKLELIELVHERVFVVNHKKKNWNELVKVLYTFQISLLEWSKTDSFVCAMFARGWLPLPDPPKTKD